MTDSDSKLNDLIENYLDLGKMSDVVVMADEAVRTFDAKYKSSTPQAEYELRKLEFVDLVLKRTFRSDIE